MQLRGRPRGINISCLTVSAVGERSRSLWGVIHGSVLFQQYFYESVRTIQSWAGSQNKEATVDLKSLFAGKRRQGSMMVLDWKTSIES